MNRIFSFFSRKNKIIIPTIEESTSFKTIESNIADSNTHYQDKLRDKTYCEIETKVRKFQILSSEDVQFLKILPPERLVKIIQLYNMHVKNIIPILDQDP